MAQAEVSCLLIHFLLSLPQPIKHVDYNHEDYDENFTAHDENFTAQTAEIKEDTVDTTRGVLQEAMQKYGIKEEMIPTERPFNARKIKNINKRSKRYIEAKGFAMFKCRREHRKWPSAHSWCFFDMKHQTIRYRYSQDCKKCNLSGTPKFSEAVLAEMADYAARKLSKRLGVRLQRRPAKPKKRMPLTMKFHDSWRCEKCTIFRRKCC